MLRLDFNCNATRYISSVVALGQLKLHIGGNRKHQSSVIQDEYWCEVYSENIHKEIKALHKVKENDTLLVHCESTSSFHSSTLEFDTIYTIFLQEEKELRINRSETPVERGKGEHSLEMNSTAERTDVYLQFVWEGFVFLNSMWAESNQWFFTVQPNNVPHCTYKCLEKVISSDALALAFLKKVLAQKM